jgi:hypothetical protein
MTEWNLQSRAHACEACGQPFADRQPYHTLLFDERAGFRRQDICAACWSKDGQAGRQHAGVVSYWQGVYEAPPPKPVDPIQRDTAETLLRKLASLNDPRYAPAAFILAVMLERKRALKVKEEFERDGGRVFVYEDPRTGDLLTIRDPQLHLHQLEQVQHDVAHLLEHGLPTEGTPAIAADAPAPTAPPADTAAEETQPATAEAGPAPPVAS